MIKTANALDRYKFRELERIVEKQRYQIRQTAQDSSFDEFEAYSIMLQAATKAYELATTAAQKDWNYINQLSVLLELKRLEGHDVSEGVRCIFPTEKLPPDIFPFGDKSL